jgi:SAM-dependent methyltransferase
MIVSWTHSALVAEIFDLGQPIGGTIGDVEYYVRALDDVTGRVLEPGCGTGRVLIPLLEAGHDAEGLDHSPDMLSRCDRYCRERGLNPPLHVGDMVTFMQPERYEAVVIPRGAIRNIEGRGSTLQALRSMWKSLQSGGRLLLDVRVPLAGSVPGPVEYWRRDPYLWTKSTVIIDHNPLTNTTVHYGRFEKWKDGEPVATELHRFAMQHWSLPEFTTLLAEAGYEEVVVTADFGPEQPSSASTYWNFRALRP